MSTAALLFGSIGSIVESSDIQRRAYNQALKEAGLPWLWDRETYSELLEQAGGKERLTMLAAATGAELTAADVEKIHARKTELAREALLRESVEPRPGVVELLRLCKERGMKTAFVTTTYRPNIDAIFAAAKTKLSMDEFDAIITREDVQHGKPSPDAYETALRRLGVAPETSVAVEDTANSVASAKRAGLRVIATPGELTAGQDFWQADLVLERLTDAHGGIDPRMLTFLN